MGYGEEEIGHFKCVQNTIQLFGKMRASSYEHEVGTPRQAICNRCEKGFGTTFDEDHNEMKCAGSEVENRSNQPQVGEQ